MELQGVRNDDETQYYGERICFNAFILCVSTIEAPFRRKGSLQPRIHYL